MAQTLREFIESREVDVKAQIRALQDELRELRAAKSAIDGGDHPAKVARGTERMTQRDMIVAVLDDHPEGGTSDKVINWVREQFGVEVSQASISSQLSRAKSDGVLTLEPSTKIWRSAKHSAKKNEPPSGGSETGEAATSPYPGFILPGALTSAPERADPAPHSGGDGGD